MTEEKEEESWFEAQNEGVNMPNWVLLLICVLTLGLVVGGFAICLSIRKKKQGITLRGKEMAIMRELSSMAKEDEAVNISDLEKYEEKPHKFLQVSDEKAMVTKAPVTRTSMGLGTTA